MMFEEMLTNLGSMFYIDRISVIMIALVCFVALPVSLFSIKYMKGDSRYGVFFYNILAVVFSVMMMAILDHFIAFALAWFLCNNRISRLMAHKTQWQAAKASSRFADRNFAISMVMFFLALACLRRPEYPSLSIQYIIHHPITPWFPIFLWIAAMTQSAIWPFHRWLASSMNAPTPVSALMHAGVVNGGGFLLLRFSPLYMDSWILLNTIFIFGLFSALLGSFLKLIQSDVKRMLVFSTISQTGFMLVQCGLGFFASALAHICWHAMFKACLFLASGNAGAEKRYDFSIRPTFVSLSFSAVCALFNSMLFAFWHQVQWSSWNTNAFVVGIVFIANMQIALTLIGNPPRYHWGRAALVSTGMTALYSATLYGFDHFLLPLDLMQPQPLNAWHIGGFALLLVSWCLVVYIKSHKHIEKMPHWVLYLYVKALNISQPNPKTITTCRKGYDYV